MPAKKSKKPITDKFKLKENLQGKNKFVAFIDVMGFSNLVYKSSGSAEALDSYFSKITDEIDDISSSTLGDKLQSFLISDSIILIAPEGPRRIKTSNKYCQANSKCITLEEDFITRRNFVRRSIL